MSRMLKNIGLFCKRALQKRPIFCKETYIFKHPTHRSHPIGTGGSFAISHMCVISCLYVCYGVATINRLLKIIGLFCKRTL